MIGRAILIWSSAIVVAINVPSMVGVVSSKVEAITTEDASVLNASASNGRSYVLKSNDGGHFEGKFRFNGKSLSAMVDTGATFVTISESDARSLGFGGNELRFRYEVMTAGGKVKAARVQLKSVEIGTVQVRNVDALVLRGKTLKFPLVGMSFMKKLGSYSADNDQMTLIN
ncbi:TIGR02281 family clan AA aspartic protease [Rhizobium sp. KVB221]|uniref:TIGR02281 family clan AA aspartic protease n=1 Tax=Rhizobium setariae TaxID=2801340 RepID=A0A936YQZ9_9HYPH|nr:TIGR02281 family clan AA aspartic protease [Rhizobium setariae]MBL0375194.1 TIGR02281 family clan AA aspartic protease [Rhizobium setariae]